MIQEFLYMVFCKPVRQHTLRRLHVGSCEFEINAEERHSTTLENILTASWIGISLRRRTSLEKGRKRYK